MVAGGEVERVCGVQRDKTKAVQCPSSLDGFEPRTIERGSEMELKTIACEGVMRLVGGAGCGSACGITRPPMFLAVPIVGFELLREGRAKDQRVRACKDCQLSVVMTLVVIRR